MKLSQSLLLLFLLTPLSAATSRSGSVDLRIDPEYVSPNSDDLKDDIFFHPVLRTPTEAVRWQLDLKTPGGSRIHRMKGADLPALIKWDARGKKGQFVKEGSYGAVLTAWTRGAKVVSPSRPFFIDMTPPQVALAVSSGAAESPDINQVSFGFTATVQDVSPLDKWQLQIIDERGRSVYIELGTGTVRPMRWNGRDRATRVMAPQGPYRAVFVAWDLAGNESAPASVDINLNVAARDVVNQVLKVTRINETSLGLIIQLNFDDIFMVKKGNLSFKPGAEQFLNEAAIIANVYGEAPISLNGYSKTRRKFQQDRDLSSVYAWKIYSWLVKNGHVEASRIEVKGRSRSPLFDRRAVQVPVVSDGVEMVIEGSGPW